ncbi:hypothetical protein Mapa_016637 [Marchantia paleacea]|nr:hypothetical protein Mapa_016637 [Marchantia paleacea]
MTEVELHRDMMEAAKTTYLLVGSLAISNHTAHLSCTISSPYRPRTRIIGDSYKSPEFPFQPSAVTVIDSDCATRAQQKKREYKFWKCFRFELLSI